MPVLGVEHDFVVKQQTEHRGIQEMFAEKATLIKAISNVDDNGSGLIRITAASHGLTTGDEVIIAGVAGTTEANGYWTVTVTSSTQFTLNSSSYANAWTSGGGVYDGVSYTVVCGSAPSSPGILALVNIKKVATNGAVVGLPTTAKKITSTTETELFISDAVYDQALSSLILTNNSGGTIAGTVKIRTTKLLNVDSQPVIYWELLDDYSIVIGGDGVRSMYKGTGLPYVS
jgi:hypothetical protein